jgi:putative aminopeptidase FrvX
MPSRHSAAAALAHGRRIPLHLGTTGGGYDGSVFTRWGVSDVPIGWPGRCTHSPVAVLDLRDPLSLTDLIRIIVERC